MTFAAGSRFGPYEITTPLGAGGMGEVYRARDTALKRVVALKVLPAALASDAERLARLQREAELLAALNHPNVAQIYGLERSDGTTALVMELVAGQSLVERLAGGALALDEALDVAGQIADALEAAHERGIVHRDLKPANIQLTSDGRVKVLDFGIAKALDAPAAGPAALTTPAMTEAGIVFGTAAYMSPEQARGKRVDQRADIWAFGCVLYELLTGKVAFGADDVRIVLARVLEGATDFSALPKGTPHAVRRTLELCLEKDPKKRIADIRDVKLSLAGRFAAAPTKRRDGWWFRPMIAAAAALALGGVVAGFAAWSLKPEARPVVRAIHRLPESVLVRGLAGRALTVSPDGSTFVYTGPDAFYVRRMDTLEERPIAGSPGEADLLNANPTFSPDGRSLAYFHAGQLRRIAVAGGASVAIAPAERVAPAGISWEADGTILYAQGRGGIWRVAEAGGSPTRVVAEETGEAMAPQLLPGDEWILYTLFLPANSVSEIRVASVATGEQRTLRTNAASARYVETGHLLYVTEGVLHAARFDLRRLEFSGAPMPVVEGVRALIPGVGQYAVAASGTLVYLPGPAQSGEAAEVSVLLDDLSGSAVPTNVPRGRYGRIRAAPNGERIALDSDERGEAIIWAADLAGSGTLQRVTFEGRNQFPVWSPDGERIAFQSTRGGDTGVWVQRVDGTAQAQRLTTPSEGEAHIPEDWSPDGEFLSVAIERGGLYSLALLSLRDGTLTSRGGVASVDPPSSSFSSDGRWIAYHLLPRDANTNSPSGGVFVEPVLPNGAQFQAPKVARDFQPVWSPDGADLYYIPSAASDQIARVTVATERGLSFGAQTLLPFNVGAQRLSGQTRAFDVLPDGRFIGLGTDVAEASPLREPQVRFVVNWFEELERLVPTE